MSGTGRPLTWHEIEACLRDLGDELDRRGLERRTIVTVKGAFVGPTPNPWSTSICLPLGAHVYARASSDQIERTAGSGSGCVSRSGPQAGRTRSQ